GSNGAAGATGPTGPTGSNGSNGSNGATGATGQGPRGYVWQFYDGGSTLTTSSDPLSYIIAPVNCTIGAGAYSAAVTTDAGTVTIKFEKASGTSLPTSGNSINTSGIALSSGNVYRTSSTSDFT